MAFLALIIVVGSLLLFFHHHRRQRKLRLPPRPSSLLPVIADALYLRELHRTLSLHALCQKLGPIFTLYLGNTPIIYVTSASLAQEALVAKGALFSARPPMPTAVRFTNNLRTVTTATYGPHWRTMRRHLVQEMLTAPKIASFKPVRRQVLDGLLLRIAAEGRQNEGVVSLYPQVRMAMFQLVMVMCFGFDVAEDTLLEISTLLDEVMVLSLGSVLDFRTFLLDLLGKQQHRIAVRNRQTQIFGSHIERHKELAKQAGRLVPGSYLETLLHRVAQIGLSADDLVCLCAEFFVAVIDTTSTTLEWTMAHLVADPDIQAKLYEEIRDAVGDRHVEESDLPNLPYLQATMNEVLRLHPPAHFLLPHAVSKPCKLGGYDIPTNAIIQFHAAGISRDEAIWNEPLKFKPERFLIHDVDRTGSKPMTMMPFGAGRRICPGLALATMQLKLFVAHLVQTFAWACAPGDSVDLDEKRQVFTIRMKRPLRSMVTERIHLW